MYGGQLTYEEREGVRKGGYIAGTHNLTPQIWALICHQRLYYR